MAQEKPYDGRHTDGDVDVFTGPTVPLAIEHAKSVGHGKLTLTSFTAWDTGELIGVDGRSLIVKLPQSCGENNRPYTGQQWFLDGTARGDIDYGPKYVSDHVETSTCWLVDIAIQNNWFADKRDREAVLFQRLKSLDSGYGMGSGIKLQPPEGYVDDDAHRFMFDVAHELDVEIGADLPVSIWYACSEGVTPHAGIMQRAREAPFACVGYLRFQTDLPVNGK